MNTASKNSTIIDIARKLGISPSTVSRALHNNPDVKQETKELVRKVAEELHYIPNPIAQSLKSSKTTTIGVMVPEIKHDFFSSAISGIEEVAYKAGYRIILCQSNESYEREVLNTRLLMQHRVAGVVVSISQNTRNSEHFQELMRRKIPLVFFDRVCEDVRANKVVIDDYQSAFNAVSYLVRKGYKTIAHFAGPQELSICKKRLQAYVDVTKNLSTYSPETLIFYGGLHEKDGYASLDSMLLKKNRPDAIFAVNDPVAVGAYQRIQKTDLKIPGDIALVGFSNNSVASLLDPQLTTVNQLSFEMGKKAAEILIDIIENKATDPETLVLETQLIERQST
jgi:DNA-binding LacI/PurR family transcriptional regulator